MKLKRLDAKELARDVAIEVELPSQRLVEIKIHRMREFKVRTAVALWLIGLATAISWARVEVVGSEEQD